jgi:hypothetical protein
VISLKALTCVPIVIVHVIGFVAWMESLATRRLVV